MCVFSEGLVWRPTGASGTITAEPSRFCTEGTLEQCDARPNILYFAPVLRLVSDTVDG